MTTLFKTQKLLLASAVISLAACSASDQPAYNQQSATTNTESAQATLDAKPVLRRSFSGSVEGETSISANQSLNLMWDDGAVNNIATTDANGNYQITLPEGVDLPAMIEVAGTDNTKTLKAIVNSLDQPVELTALSTVIAEELVGEYVKGQAISKLAGLSSSEVDMTAGDVINKVFGQGLTINDIQSNDQLKTALLAALKNLNDNQSTLDTLRSAIDTQDTSISGSLLSNDAFQTVLAGVFSSQNASSGDVMSLLSATGVHSHITEKMSNRVASFDAVKQMAEKSEVNNAVVDQILESSSKVASEVLQGVKPEDVSNVLEKVLGAVSPALVDMVKNTLPEGMSDQQIAEVVNTAANQATKVITDQSSGAVAEMSDSQFEQIKGQLSDVAKLVGGPVGDIVSGSLLNGVSKEQANIIVDTIGDNIGAIASTYIDQLGKGALPEEALAQASLAAAPVAESISAMLIKDTVQNATPEVINTLIQTVGQVSLNQITGAENTADANTVQNMLDVVTGALSGANLNTDQIADIITSPDQAQTVVTTLTQAATALIGMTQEGSVDSGDEQSGANLIENVVKAVLPVMVNATTTSQTSTESSATNNEAQTSSTETTSSETAPAISQQVAATVVSDLIESAPQIIEAIDSQDIAALADSAKKLFEATAGVLVPSVTSQETVEAPSDTGTTDVSTTNQTQTSAIESDTAVVESTESGATENNTAENDTTAPFTLVVDGKETTVVDAIANAAQNMLVNLGQQAFGALFAPSSTES